MNTDLNTDFTGLNDPLENLYLVKMSTKGIAEVLNMEHKTVLRDFKTMYVEVDGGDDFIAHRITGGLTKNEYIRSNVSTLFPELRELKDGTDGYHPIFKGLQVETDSRGYTTEIIMGKSAARAFAARFSSVEAVKLSTYVDYLEEDAKKKEIEAITKRVVNTYRVNNTEIEYTPKQYQKMFAHLPSEHQDKFIHALDVEKFSRYQMGIIYRKFGNHLADFCTENDISSGKQIEDMKTVPQHFLPKHTEENVVDGNITPNEEFLRTVYECMKDNDTLSVETVGDYFGMSSYKGKVLFDKIYDLRLLKNGQAQTMSNYHSYNRKCHQQPYSTVADKGYFFIKKYFIKKIGTTKGQTRVTRGGFKFLCKKVLGITI